MLDNTEPTLMAFLETLRKDGYEAGFKIGDNNKVECVENKKEYSPHDLQIVKLHRFEGESDPSDSSIVYAVKGKDGLKGVIISAYGMYGSASINNFMKEVESAKKENIVGPVKEPVHQ